MTNNDTINAMRELSAEEIGSVGGGATNTMNYLTYIRRLVQRVQNAPENATLVDCGADMSWCLWVND